MGGVVDLKTYDALPILLKKYTWSVIVFQEKATKVLDSQCVTGGSQRFTFDEYLWTSDAKCNVQSGHPGYRFT